MADVCLHLLRSLGIESLKFEQIFAKRTKINAVPEIGKEIVLSTEDDSAEEGDSVLQSKKDGVPARSNAVWNL